MSLKSYSYLFSSYLLSLSISSLRLRIFSCSVCDLEFCRFFSSLLSLVSVLMVSSKFLMRYILFSTSSLRYLVSSYFFCRLETDSVNSLIF